MSACIGFKNFIKKWFNKMKYPPLRPEEQTAQLFSLLEENVSRLKEQQQKTVKLRTIHEKLDRLLAILQSIDDAIINNKFNVPKNIPKKFEKELVRLFDLLETLDREKYSGFYRRIKTMNDKILKKAIGTTRQLQVQKQKTTPDSSSVRITLLPPRTQLNQLLSNLPAPPRLRRSTTQFF
jgi:hypothetical protein